MFREPEDTVHNNDDWHSAIRRLQWHLYRRDLEPCRGDVTRYCQRLTGNADIARDLVQETMLRGFDTTKCLARGPDNPPAFLVRVARNLWFDRQRRRRVAQKCLGFEANAAEVATDEDPAVSVDIEAALGALPRRERQILVLQTVFGYTGREIARELGISEAAVKMAAHRARRRAHSLFRVPQ